MTPPCKPFYFTGKPDMAENATDWLSTVEANIQPSMTNREKVDFFSSWFQRASPARKWFNKLPDEGHRRWHLVRAEFESKWCKTTDIPILVASLSTDILPQIPDVPASTTPLSDTAPQLSPPEPVPEINTKTMFTVSYTPLLYPEPAATRSGTNAIQVTQFELTKMLQQAFQQGMEQSERNYQLELADAIETLNAQHQDRRLEDFNDFADRVQESTDNAYGEGILAGIRDEREHWELARASQISIATQTDLASTVSISIQTDALVIPDSLVITSTPTMATASVQSDPPVISPSSFATISTQTETLLPTETPSESLSIPILESPILATSVLEPFNWADDAVSLPTIPIISSKQPRDLSILRSPVKNPFSSLRRRQGYPKYSHTVSSHHYTQPYPTRRILPIGPVFTRKHPFGLGTLPTPAIPKPFPLKLDWDVDPRLADLSRALRALGWAPVS